MGPCAGILFYHLSKGKKGFSSPLATAQPMRGSDDSANEKPLYFQCPVYPMDVLFIIACKTSRFPLQKSLILLYCLDLPMVFGGPCLFGFPALCFSQTDSSFACKGTGSFIFKINITW